MGFVSKSGGMSNEMYNVLARATDGLFEGARLLRLLLRAQGPLYCCQGSRALGGVRQSCSQPCFAERCLRRWAGIAIGGDSFPGSTLSDHCLRYQNIPQVSFGLGEPVGRAAPVHTFPSGCLASWWVCTLHFPRTAP